VPTFQDDLLPVGLLMLDAGHVLLRANRHAAELLGLAGEAMPGRRFDELLTPASRLLYHSHVVPLLQLHGRAEEIELTLLGNGQRQAALFNAVLQADEHAGGDRIHAALVRLGERRRLEEQLRNAQRATEHLPGMLFQLLLGAGGQWSMPYASDGLRRLHGLTPEQVRDQLQPWWASLHPQDLAEVEASLHDSARRLVEWHAHYRSRAGRRDVWVRSRATPQRLSDASVLWHGYSEDISDLHQLDLARRDKLAAEAANAAKSEFLANMSHEIRTPIHVMLGLTQLLQRDAPRPDQAARLAQIDTAGHHLMAVASDVLDVARIEAGRLDLEELDLDLAELCAQVLAMVGDTARAKGLALSLDLADTPGAWRGDPTRLRQALLNLVSNAVKFTERGTVHLSVRVSVRQPSPTASADLANRQPAAASAPPAHPVAGQPPRLLHFEVADSGPGLSATTLTRLFEPFSQADSSTTRRHGGSGLGLVITRRLARLMGGDAGARSTPGVGSRFWFTALLSPGGHPAAHADTLTQEHDLLSRAAGLRVLVVDDQPVNLEVTADLLGAVGLRVELAHDGQEALDRLSRSDAPCDLVLMDMQMPRLDGLQATAAIRRLPGRAGLPIIAMTANAFAADRAACLAAGMNDYISKPVELARLYAALLRWLPLRGVPVELVPDVAASSSDDSSAGSTTDATANSTADATAASTIDASTGSSTVVAPEVVPGVARSAAVVADSPLDEQAWRARLLGVPGLDAGRGLYQVRDRLPAYLRVLGVFVHSLRKAQADLLHWLAEHPDDSVPPPPSSAAPGTDTGPAVTLGHNSDHLTALVHRIKGSAAAVGAMSLHGQAAQAEALIRQRADALDPPGSRPDLHLALQAMAAEAAHLAAALDQLLAV
jgi:signal transduction histidine kinase/DNA-binding NarL/FixJ family response regulator/HPt (histidine-containing phosphotransfer) domain-containing protein